MMKALSALSLALMFLFATGCACISHDCRAGIDDGKVVCKTLNDCGVCNAPKCEKTVCPTCPPAPACPAPTVCPPPVVQKDELATCADIPDMNIYFDTNKYDLMTTGDAKPNHNMETLDKIVDNLNNKDNDWLGVFIASRCDERGSVELNHKLGENRAMSVKKYLMDKGIAENRIKVINSGKESPICPEKTKECYAINRSAAIYWFKMHTN